MVEVMLDIPAREFRTRHRGFSPATRATRIVLSGTRTGKGFVGVVTALGAQNIDCAKRRRTVTSSTTQRRGD
jgi:hypothetical protein